MTRRWRFITTLLTRREKEFWAIIEEIFVQVKSVLTDYPVKTREEALRGTLRNHLACTPPRSVGKA